MKQLLFMIATTALGTVGVFVVGPFVGVAVYYMYAVLRPQYLWLWALPPGVEWSFYVACATMIGAAFEAIRLAARQHSEGSPFSRAHIAVLVFGGWVGLSYLTARDSAAAYPVFLEYLKIFVMFTVATVVIHTVRQIWILFIVIALSLGYIAYEMNFKYLTQGFIEILSSGYGGLDNNGAALLLAMGTPVCSFAWEAIRSAWRWVFAALIPLLLHAVLMSYSRGAMLALVAAAPLVFLRSARKGSLLAAALVLAVALPVMAGPEIRARFFSISEHERDASAQSRFSTWQAGWSIARDNPIVGVGPRNSPHLLHLYDPELQGFAIHSQYIQIAADSGFGGLALYAVAFAAVWLAIRRTRSNLAGAADSPDVRQALAVASGIECGLVIFCLGAVFLSLEVVELPYLMMMLAAQLSVISGRLASPEAFEPAEDEAEGLPRAEVPETT